MQCTISHGHWLSGYVCNSGAEPTLVYIHALCIPIWVHVNPSIDRDIIIKSHLCEFTYPHTVCVMMSVLCIQNMSCDIIVVCASV